MGALKKWMVNLNGWLTTSDFCLTLIWVFRPNKKSVIR